MEWPGMTWNYSAVVDIRATRTPKAMAANQGMVTQKSHWYFNFEKIQKRCWWQFKVSQYLSRIKFLNLCGLHVYISLQMNSFGITIREVSMFSPLQRCSSLSAKAGNEADEGKVLVVRKSVLVSRQLEKIIKAQYWIAFTQQIDSSGRAKGNAKIKMIEISVLGWWR